MSLQDADDLAELGRLGAQMTVILERLQQRNPPVADGPLPTLDARTVAGRSDLLRRPKPPLPDPRLIRSIIRQRRLRDRYFESELFADAGWDILLDLAAAREEHRRVSVTSLCVAAAVPATTALRWLTMMTRMGILVRQEDEADKRRAFIALSDSAADSLARYFDEIGSKAGTLI